MPPRTASLPKYRHYKPKNLAVVRIDGRDHYLGKYGSPASWERYHRLMAERAVSANPTVTLDPVGPSASNPTIAEIILAFWKHALQHYRGPDGTPSKDRGNIKAALRPLRALYGMIPAEDFGLLALRAVRQRMIDDGLARTSVNARVNRVRRSFRWAASIEMVPVAVVQALATVAGLQKGRSEAREPDPVGPVAIDRVEATSPRLSRPVAGLMRLLQLTGMRSGEACVIRGRDLRAGEPNWTYTPASHKTAHLGKCRVIPLGPRAVAVVEGSLTADPEAYLFRPADAVAEHHARRAACRVSRTTPSEVARRKAAPGAGHAARYRRHTLRNAINRACDKAFPHPVLLMIPTRRLGAAQKAELATWRTSHRWSPNQLRHLAATEIRSRYGLEAAQTVLGHSWADLYDCIVQVTQVYAERDLARVHDVMREIG